MSGRPADRLVSPHARASARKRANAGTETRQAASLHRGTLGGSNRMLSSRDVAAILAIPERSVRDRWKEWGLPAYRIGKHLRWKERDVYAWIERQSA